MGQPIPPHRTPTAPIQAEQGYFLGPLGLTVYKCEEPAACPGGKVGNATGASEAPPACAAELGYSGRLCQTCLPGFGRTGKFACSQCDAGATALFFVGVLAVSLLVLFGMVWYSLRNARDRDINDAVLFKVFSSGLQVGVWGARTFAFDFQPAHVTRRHALMPLTLHGLLCT